MAPMTLQSLPPELTHSILTYLPIPSLLAFSQTSKVNQIMAIRALTHLELAIFPKKIHSMLAFLDSRCQDEEQEDEMVMDDIKQTNSLSQRRRPRTIRPISKRIEPVHQVGLTTSPSFCFTDSSLSCCSSPSVSAAKTSVETTHSSPTTIKNPCTKSSKPSIQTLRANQITQQNHLATTIFRTAAVSNLHSLVLNLYALTSPSLASALLHNLPHLQHLILNFSHPHIHDPVLPARYWTETPSGAQSGSTAWNAFSGIGDANHRTCRSKGLRSLCLRRAGITGMQLRRWIEQNRELEDLKLEMVRGVDLEFLDWLADSNNQVVDNNEMKEQQRSPNLKSISLQSCANLILKTRSDFTCLDRLVKSSSSSHRLTSLNMRGCSNVNEDMFLRLALGYDNEMDTRREGEGWTQRIDRIISPKGVVIHRGGRRLDSSSKSTELPPVREGMVRHASWSHLDSNTDNNNGTGGGVWKVGVIEVDPDF